MAITLGGSYVTSGLVLHLDSRNTSSYSGSGTVWTDLVGSGINAALVNSPTYSSGAITFNGSTQYAIISNNTSLDSQSITMESWCMLTKTVQEGFIFEKGVVNTQYSMFFESGGNFIFRTQGLSNGDLSFKANTYVPTNTWVHIVCTYSGGVKSIYVNGVLVAQVTGITGTIPTTATGSSVGVYGGYSGGRAYYFNGGISLIRVYNRALSLAEIKQNFSYGGITLGDGSVQGSAFVSANDTGKLLATTTFSAAGAGTWTKPAGCRKVIVKVVAGGGGATGHCESGGAGGYSEKVIDVTAVSTVAVTVGGGGAAAGYYTVCAQGGTSSFGSYCSATGGYGANQNASHTGGHGGVGSSGDVNFLGGSGTGHANNGSQQCVARGGSTYWGGCSGTSHNNHNPSNIYYMAPGTGGTGGNQGYNYRAGAAGLVVVYSYA